MCGGWWWIGWLLLAAGVMPAQTKLLRFPDVHGDRVVFTYAGDLWTAPVEGGTARRLTAHPGLELFAKFSPDGGRIAFVGQYDGDEQVYVIPSGGGVPQQLTFYPAAGPLPPRWGYDNQVYGWTPDGQAVLFRSLRDGFDLTDSRLYTVRLDGALPEALPMPVSGAGDLSPGGGKVVYSPLFRDFRTWKRYAGGWAQDLYIFDLETHEAVPVTEHPRSDRDPMWMGETIYFTSDRDGKLNIYGYHVPSGETRQLTNHRSWDVRWPGDDGESRIVYELNGELHLLDVASEKTRRIPISVPTDALPTRPTRVDASEDLEGFGLSPKGERALFVARGDVFTVPVEEGITRNLTASSGAHDKHAAWSPDGRHVAYISDAGGEEQLYMVEHQGGDPVQITQGVRGMCYRPRWAPGGARLAFSDKEGRIWVLELEGRQLLEVADERRGLVRDYTWSPDGRHLAFSLSEPSELRSLHIWSAADGETRKVTGPESTDYGPCWDLEGRYLYFLSDRTYQPQIGAREWNYVLDRETGIYALALRKDVEHLFPPEVGAVTVEEEKEGDDKPGDEKDTGTGDQEDEGADRVSIDFQGLGARVLRVPVDPDNLTGLSAAKGHLVYVRTGPFYYGRSSDVKPGLRIFDLDEEKEHTLAEKVSGYALSGDGKKVLVRSGSTFTLMDVKKGGGEKKKVSLEGLKLVVDHREEWAQIFEEVWRRYRDFFYVENMHGYDWEALGERYRGLLEHVGHRSDLNYLMGEMIAELEVSHAYVAGGDFEIPDRPEVGLLGARLEADRQAGRYRIARILPGHNAEPRYRSPLTEVGVEVSEGDFLLAVDGHDLTLQDNPYRLLRHKAGSPVELLVGGSPDPQSARRVVVRPVDSEDPLLYLAWILENHRRVAELSDGRVGYLHLPDMGADGLREFIKWFYPQVRKQGLVIDVRGNGGGNVSQMLIERLRRELLATGYARTWDVATTYPYRVFAGHMACILDEDSASDGDIFPAMFRKAGLGPLVGKRSWGGVVGIAGRGPLIDGGSVYVPEFGFGTAEGDWTIEGHGVEPDIVVENPPKAVIEGRDPQLERAVQEVLDRIQEDPPGLPPRPEPPVKSR